MKRLWNSIGWMAAATLLFTACSQEQEVFENAYNPENVAPDAGCYIVDYTEVGDAGNHTRALLADGTLEPNQRITSLTYLLYEGDELMKTRKISDINPQTQWPLTRENMTWAQRQELKDTLELNRAYTAIFIANSWVDETFDENGVLDETNQLLKNRSNLAQAYLIMPSNGFTDGTMYYVSKQDFSFNTGNAEGIDRNHPYNCPVTLKRIAARTDIQRLNTGLNGSSTDTDDFNAFLEGVLKSENGLATLQLADQGPVYNHLKDELNGLASSYNNETGTYLASYNKLADAIEASIDQIWQDQKTRITELVQKTLLEDCAENTAIQTQCAPWQNYQTLTVNYNQPANAFALGTLSAAHRSELATAGNLTYDIYAADSDTPGKVVIAGLGNQDATTNVIQSLTLTKEDNTTLTFNSLNCQTGNGQNELLRLVCNPLSKLEAKTDAMTKTLTGITIRLEDYVNIGECYVALTEIIEGASEEDFIAEVKEKLSQYGAQYGSWEQFVLQITIPDMSQTSNAVCTPALSKATE